LAIACKEGIKKGIGKILVMEKILIFIKHHFSTFWKIIEWANGIIFFLFYKSKMEKTHTIVLRELGITQFKYRRLNELDAEALFILLNTQTSTDLSFFNPHDFKLTSILSQFNNRSFLMMGTFDNDRMVGYFFLRFFANRKCFVGRLIDREYRGKGIGPVMNNIMYETAWRMGFRCLSTISRNNEAVMHAHSKNKKMVIIKELHNDYLLVEFIKHPID
jgi:hypothetical protein